MGSPLLSPPRTATALPLGALLLMCAIGSAHAERWYVEPKARLYGFWEDNIRLSTVDRADSGGFILRGDVEAGRKTQVSEISINSAAVARQYFQESDLNTTDFYFDGLGVYRAERNAFQLRGRYVLDSTLTSEEETSGFVQTRNRRDTWLLAPRWTNQLTERASIYAQGSYQEVDYDDDAVRFTDYRYATLGAGAAYALSERTDLLGDLSYARYEAKDSSRKSDTLGVKVGVAHSFSETLQLRLLAGARQSDTANRILGGDTEDESSNGGIFDLNLNKQFEVGSLNLAAYRDLKPSGSGDLLDTLGVRVRWDQRITARWRWSLAANAYRNAQPSGDTSGRDRDFFSIAPELAYIFDEEWSISGGYRFRYQKYEADPDSAEANAVFFTLRYTPLIER